MKRISILLSCLLLAIGGTALAQGGTHKSVAGRVISSSAYALAIQTDADVRLNLVLNSTTSKPAILTDGDRVAVVYRDLDAGGYEAISVTAEAEAKEPATAAGTPTRTLTNVGTPGTGGQTGESRTSTVGTTGGYHAPGNPAQPTKADGDSMSNDERAAMPPMNPAAKSPETMDHGMMDDNDKIASDRMAADRVAADQRARDQRAQDRIAANSAVASTDGMLPRTASHEPTILLIGLGALVAALFMFRRRATV